MKHFALAAAAMLALPSAANAVAFMNGSFETGPAPGSFVTLPTGDTSITGWTVTGGSIDYIGSYWVASDGDRSLDLSGLEAGTIEQTFDTVAGRSYVVTFDLAGNPAGAPNVKDVTVSAGTASQSYSFDTTGATLTDMNWTGQTFSFVAGGASSTLSFASNTAGFYGPALDNFSVTAVPEPATWAMMIGGIAAAGGALRSRRRRTVAMA